MDEKALQNLRKCGSGSPERPKGGLSPEQTKAGYQV